MGRGGRGVSCSFNSNSKGAYASNTSHNDGDSDHFFHHLPCKKIAYLNWLLQAEKKIRFLRENGNFKFQITLDRRGPRPTSRYYPPLMQPF
jgi:hypothetical protein